MVDEVVHLESLDLVSLRRKSLHFVLDLRRAKRVVRKEECVFVALETAVEWAAATGRSRELAMYVDIL